MEEQDKYYIEVDSILKSKGLVSGVSSFTPFIKEQIVKGFEVELNEHPVVVKDNRALALLIALNHLVEIPDYYTRLDIMEKQAELEWSNSFVGTEKFKVYTDQFKSLAQLQF